MGEKARRTAEALEGRVVRPRVVGDRYGESGRGAPWSRCPLFLYYERLLPKRTSACCGHLRPSERVCMKTERTASKDIIEEAAMEKTE